jgi:hypothetical protein
MAATIKARRRACRAPTGVSGDDHIWGGIGARRGAKRKTPPGRDQDWEALQVGAILQPVAQSADQRRAFVGRADLTFSAGGRPKSAAGPILAHQGGM